MVKSLKGSALVIFPPFLLFLELWKGRGKERGYITERFSRKCRILRKTVEEIWEANWGDGDHCRLRRVGAENKKREKREQSGQTKEMLLSAPWIGGAGYKGERVRWG